MKERGEGITSERAERRGIHSLHCLGKVPRQQGVKICELKCFIDLVKTIHGCSPLELVLFILILNIAHQFSLYCTTHLKKSTSEQPLTLEMGEW